MSDRLTQVSFAFVLFVVLLLSYAAQSVMLNPQKILITLAISLVCGWIFPAGARITGRMFKR